MFNHIPRIDRAPARRTTALLLVVLFALVLIVPALPALPAQAATAAGEAPEPQPASARFGLPATDGKDKPQAPAAASFEDRSADVPAMPNVNASRVTWGDYDNDGRLDFLIAGCTAYQPPMNINCNGRASKLYHQKSNGTFEDKSADVPGMPAVESAAAAWGDYDNDGRLDFLFGGWGSGFVPVSKLYHQKSDGTFEDKSADVPGMPNVARCSLKWGDYDNDGRLDFLLCGFDPSTQLEESRLYHQKSDGTFEDKSSLVPGMPGIYDGMQAWGDYDNDGRLDFLHTGYNPNGYVSRLYHQKSDGTFEDRSADVPGMPGVSSSAVAWGDYDNDGRLDFLIAGSPNASSGVSKLYHQKSDRTFEDKSADVPGMPGKFWATLAWGDYDNDGRLDFLLGGWGGSAGDLSSRLYHQKSDGTFEDKSADVPGMPSAYRGSVAWGDYDDDGKLDFLMTGATIPTSKLYRSIVPAANSAPGVPGNQAVSTTSTSATFTWDAAADAETPAGGLSYNLRVGSTPGSGDLYSSMASAGSGQRRIAAPGPIQSTSYTLNLPNADTQTFYWAVQAIDNGLRGGHFEPLPDLAIVKTNNVGGKVALGSSWNWTLTVTNTGDLAATFANGAAVLIDTLPNANISYGSPSVVDVVDVTDGGSVTDGSNIFCEISGSYDLNCAANGAVVIAPGGHFAVRFSATPSAAGAYANPRASFKAANRPTADGACAIDFYEQIAESDESNNSCSDTVTVLSPDLTIVKTNDVGSKVTPNTPWNWTITITNSGEMTATFFGGQQLLVDNLPRTNITTANFNVVNVVGVTDGNGGTSTSNISCSVSTNARDLTCVAASAELLIAPGGHFAVTFSATPRDVMAYPNPRSGGVCTVDPGDAIIESDANNNSCSDTVTVMLPNLTVVKTNDVGGTVAPGNSWNWTIAITNTSEVSVTIPNQQPLLHDTLHDTDISYGSPSVVNIGGIGNPGNIKCVINGFPDLDCFPNGGPIVIGPGGHFSVTFSATPSAVTTYANPRSGGFCAVDSRFTPDSDVSNNSCADTVTVVAPEIPFWIDKVNVTSAGRTITRNSLTKGWNAGATSNIAISSGDGYVETTVYSDTDYFFMGLGKDDADQSYNDIDFAWYARPVRGLIYVYEAGAPRAWFAYANGDVLRVEVEGTQVKYYQNGILRHTSAAVLTPDNYPLRLDTSLYNSGAKVYSATLQGAVTVTVTPNPAPVALVCEPVSWINKIYTSASDNTLTKSGGGGHFNGGAVSDRVITDGEGYAEATIASMTDYSFFGLSKGDTNQHYSDIDYAIYTYPPTGKLIIYEGGVSKGSVADYALGDQLRVAVEAGKVKFYQDGTLIYTSQTTLTEANYPLLVDSSMSTVGNQVADANICGTVGSLMPTRSFAPFAATQPAQAQAQPLSFGDVRSGDYFYQAVGYLSSIGVVSGYADGTFRPYNDTTRGQLAKMIVLARGWRLIYSPIPTFGDLDIMDTLYPYVETAAANGLVAGYSDGTFRPNTKVTRGQLAKMVVLGLALPLETPAARHFGDVSSANPFYQFVETAYANGLIGGYADGSYRPGNSATRGQIAAIIYRAISDN